MRLDFKTGMITLAALATFGVVYVVTPGGSSPAAQATLKAVSDTATFYPNCSLAWAADAAPMNRGEPGYRAALDADGDGVACEPMPGSGSHDGHHRRKRRRW